MKHDPRTKAQKACDHQWTRAAGAPADLSRVPMVCTKCTATKDAPKA